MLDPVFKSIFDTASTATQTLKIGSFFICLAAALILGLVLAAAYAFRSHHTKSFFITLTLLPAAVAVVIMMVNGNIGAGVAVAGAFSLVRFRSVPGSAREIVMIFLAMGAGLIIGMGYVAFAALFTLIMCAVYLLYSVTAGKRTRPDPYKTLKITIPEDLDYTDIFDDLFESYTTFHELVGVKTANMGSMFKLTYDIRLKDAKKEKELIDALRCRNGNLEISVSRYTQSSAEL